MSYLALYRKFRPKTFDEVIDQKHITQTLINQIKKDNIGHAYLFTGSRGTGKTSTAKIFAKAINCLSPKNGSPCFKCEVCKTLETDSNMDILEIDAASNNGVDNIRDLRENVKYTPVSGKYKVYIVDEVHMLSPQAFNALLKTLEEPPAHVVFILATTEVHKLPATILSRCMRFDFNLVSTEQLVLLLMKILKENNVPYENEALELIARAGEGSVRDTLSIADMCISYTDSNITFESVVQLIGSVKQEKLASIAESCMKDDIGEVLTLLDGIFNEGKSPLVLAKELITFFRDLLVVLTVPSGAKRMVVAQSDIFERMKNIAIHDNYNRIAYAIEVLSGVEAELRYSVHPKIVLETCMVKIISDNTLAKRVKELESKLAGGHVIDRAVKDNSDTEDKNEKDSRNENSSRIKTAKELWGECLSFLRKQKEISLYTACEDVEFKTEKDTALLHVRSNATFEVLELANNKKIMTEFFKERGYNLKTELQKTKPVNADTQKLEKLFGNKLTIEK